ncbi:MAG: hypothetical protein E7029_02890 [Planctomycetaceae bacterium]|nr:hypothetical protein [Planctomycetaceae bacterium]
MNSKSQIFYFKRNEKKSQGGAIFFAKFLPKPCPLNFLCFVVK